MTTPSNDRQTSERERLAKELVGLCRWQDGSVYDKAAAQLRADEAEIAQLRVDLARLRLTHTETAANLAAADEQARVSDEIIAALRAENEALRTVTPDDVERSLDEYYRDTNKYHGSAHDETKKGFRDKMRAALQSFIRSKESRRG
jgi:hypothetical protein